MDGLYSVFVLLDHMNWLSAEPEMLSDEWRWILQRARPDARVIYRSGGTNTDLREFAVSRLEFDPETAARLHTEDRVGTHGSFHLVRLTS